MESLKGKRILVIDDEPDLVNLVKAVLNREGANIYTASNGSDGLKLLHTHQPDLVLLDIMMPGLPGFETCTRIIETSKTPVIFLTAKTRDNDIVNGLNLGAVDYVTKPFTPKVLIARINAVLRFLEDIDAGHSMTSYDDGYLQIDVDKRYVSIKGESVHLTATEFSLLAYLLTNADQVLTFAEILVHVWGPAYRSSTNYVHVYVSRLRKKIEQNPRQPRYLVSAPGVGYRFASG